jgi:thioredoxin-like negative regulator of GroEL
MALLRDGTGTPEFSAAVSGPGVTVVEVYGPDCQICKRIEPMIAAFEGAMDGVVKAYKLDASRDVDFAARHDVRGLPTVLLFKDGALADRRSGFMTTTMLKDWVRPFLG